MPMASTLKRLEEQLTCAVCLDLYIDPRTLPCLHSFCLKCLERLSQHSQEGAITCPTCHHYAELPKPAGAAGFLVAFKLNQLTEIYNQMKKESTPQQVTCDNCKKVLATSYCKECEKSFCQGCLDMHENWAAFATHQIINLEEVKISASPTTKEIGPICSSHQEPLQFFCEACDEVICLLCTKETHKSHEYKNISASYDRHCQLLQSCLVPVKEKVSGIKSALAALTVTENAIREQGEMMREEIHVMVEDMMIGLKSKLGKEIEAVIQEKLQVLSKQRNSAEMSLRQVKDCEEYVEQILKEDSPQQVLTCKKEMMERMSQVTQQINTEEFNPIEKADMRLTKDSKAVKSLDDIGVVISTSALQQCKVNKISNIQHHPNKKMVSFHLSMKLPNLNLLVVPPPSLICSLIPVGKGQPIPTTVTSTTQRGVYRIQFNPSTSGPHQVNVLVHDIRIRSATLSVPVNPYLNTITPVRTIDKFNNPWGVAVSRDGHVVVTENNSNGRVVVLDKDGKKLKWFGGEGGKGNVKFCSPQGVAITPDNHIFVADQHRIQKITMDGQLVASVGKEGSGQLQLKQPCGMTISPVTERIYVAERYNHRVQVLTPDLAFARLFGKEGTGEGQFKESYDISIDSKGLLYITDQDNHRIQKFTPEGMFLGQFGTRGSGAGQLDLPEGITVDANNDNLVYVTEWNNHRISVFTSEGQFLCSYGEQGINEDQFKNPAGMTIDKEGTMYVCDYSNNRLVVY